MIRSVFTGRPKSMTHFCASLAVNAPGLEGPLAVALCGSDAPSMAFWAANTDSPRVPTLAAAWGKKVLFWCWSLTLRARLRYWQISKSRATRAWIKCFSPEKALGDRLIRRSPKGYFIAQPIPGIDERMAQSVVYG